jgi:CheY-like chemotaxis protein
VRFSVADRGPGIPEQEKRQIFEPYVQGRAGAEQGEGTGLGLAICRRLVDLFGGEIGVLDREAGGVVFWFTIPLTPASAPPAGAAAGPAARPLRVLLVEDNPAGQYLARSLLERLGHDVTVVAEPDLAEATIASHRFDLVLLDRRLRGGDGLELLRRIRAGPQRGVAVIMATAAGDGEVRAAALAAGADAFLSKPYSFRMLAEAIARLREGRAA